MKNLLFSSKKEGYIPFKEACKGILLSLFLFAGPGAIIITYCQLYKKQRMRDPNYQITVIEQTGPQKEALKSSYLAEMLGLSISHPTNLYLFNEKQAEEVLLSNPLIKSAKVTKIPPNKIYIDYTVRNPVAYVYDYTNTAIDEEGVLFPMSPFFTPKILPQIYLGLPDLSQIDDQIPWGKQIDSANFNLALKLLSHLKNSPDYSSLRIRYIDVSFSMVKHYGSKQIVMILEDQVVKEKEGVPILYVYPRILRLDTRNYLDGLDRYLVLKEYLLQRESLLQNKKDQEDPSMQSIIEGKTLIIDLRLPQLAFLKEVNIIEDG